MKKLLLILSIMSGSASFASTKFHVALPIQSTEGVQDFYQTLLGGKYNDQELATRSEVNVDLYGHSLVFRIYPEFVYKRNYPVGIGQYPEADSQHFGLLVSKQKWEEIEKEVKRRLEETGEDLAEIKPFQKHLGTEKEVGFMILRAPSGYSFEVKYTIGSIHTPIQEVRKDL